MLTDEAVRTLDPNVKMNPPLGAEDDRKALVEALRDGTISCVATDHAPHARHEKEVPFEAAPFGVTGLETAFAALYTHLVEPGLLSLETLLERMSAGPARAYGLDAPQDRGRRAREPRPARHAGELAGGRGRLQVAARRTRGCSARSSAAGCGDDRRRPGGARVMTGFLLLEDGTRLPRASPSAPRASRSARRSSRPR